MRRTTTTRRATRAFWLVVALWQLALPGAAAWADARLDFAGAHAAAHIESHSTSSCARIHPLDCALCHFLTAPVVTTAPATVPIATADETRSGRVDPVAPLHPLARAHPQPRAPPTLS